MDILGFLDRWRLTDKTTGYLFRQEDYLTIGRDITFPLPVSITFRSVGKLVVTKLDKLDDTVKQRVGFHGWQLSLSGTAGNWKARTMPPLPDIPVVGGMIEQGYGIAAMLVGMDQVMEVPAWLKELSRKVLYQHSPSPISDKGGLLADLGITHIVFDPNTLQIRPGGGVNEYLWSVTAWSDTAGDPLEKLFPKEEEGAGEV